MPYVYSTSTCPVNINKFAPAPAKPDGRPLTIIKTITINGGANVLTKNTPVTPLGAVTKVSDEDLEFLQQDPTFQNMVKNGFFKVDNKNVKIEKAVWDMNAKDKSAPTVDSDYEGDENGNLKPIVSKHTNVMV